MPKQPVVFRTKLGAAKKVERSRIWIEGQRLVDAGFKVGSYFHKDWDEDPKRPILVLVLLKDENDVLSGPPCKVSGKGDKPIIDITGEKVREVFGRLATHVNVRFMAGMISISADYKPSAS